MGIPSTTAIIRLVRCFLISSSRAFRSLSSDSFLSTLRDAVYPIPSMADIISATDTRDGSYSTWAFASEKLTATDSTPLSFFRTFSIFWAHAAHVMPPISNVILSFTTPYPIDFMASSISFWLTSDGS